MRLARNASMASTEVTWAFWGMGFFSIFSHYLNLNLFPSLIRGTIKIKRKIKIKNGTESVLIEVFLDSLRLPQQEWGLLVRHFDELLEGFHGLLEFLGEFGMFLVLPGVTEGGEAGLERDDAVLEVGIEPLKFLGESPHLFGVHDCLGHNRSFFLDE